MALSDPQLSKLVSLIKNSFRVHPNHDPVYVDIDGNIARISAPQHQVIFGRRGSGKSCLVVHFHRHHNGQPNLRSIYLSADEVKRLSFPDLLVRLLLTTLKCLPQRRGLLRRKTLAAHAVRELHDLLDRASEQDVSETQTRRDADESELGAQGSRLSARRRKTQEVTRGRTAAFKESKLDFLERHLDDFKAALADGISRMGVDHLAIIIDDFYLISPSVQPDVIDHLHRLVRGCDAYLKVATIRHRSRLLRYEGGQTIGVEPRQDYEPIDLDQTFENMERTHAQLSSMLNSLGNRVGIASVSDSYFNAEALFALTLASGGVPRDFLNVFVEAISAARAAGSDRWLTKKYVYKGSARESYRTKLRNFREDAGNDVAPLERTFQDLLEFCLREKRRTAFLVSQIEAQADPEGHELVQQLMDFKLIHVVEADTSAASGRAGRYEAYTLDFSSFMEPRRRNIEIVEFWSRDEQRRVAGVREAPVYELARARSAAQSLGEADAEELAEALDDELGLEVESSGEEHEE